MLFSVNFTNFLTYYKIQVSLIKYESYKIVTVSVLESVRILIDCQFNDNIKRTNFDMAQYPKVS